MPYVFTDPAALIPALDALPAPWTMLALLLYLTFVLHLIMVNAVVGVAVITLFYKLRAACGSAPADSLMAGRHTTDLLLPKGVAFAVNFGIAPFLFLQCLYGQYLYASSVLMALWWLAVMPLVLLAYYGFYINMYRGGPGQAARTTALALSVALLLVNAFFFVNNMTMMQNPVRWLAYAQNSAGTLLNFDDPQMPPRYLHIILACLAVGGLVLSAPSVLASKRPDEKNSDLPGAAPLPEARRSAMRWFFYATLAQIPVGAWFFLSLPKTQQNLFMGGDAFGSAAFALGLVFTLACLHFAWKERFWLTSLAALASIMLMAAMRGILRSSMLSTWYSPDVRQLDPGPLLLFAGALIFSAAALFWLVRIYLRHSLPEVQHGSAAPGPIAGSGPGEPDARLQTASAHAREREALLVIELVRSDSDEKQSAADADDAAGISTAGGAKS